MYADISADSVLTSGFFGAYMLTNHLLSLSYRDIGITAYAADIPEMARMAVRILPGKLTGQPCRSRRIKQQCVSVFIGEETFVSKR